MLLRSLGISAADTEEMRLKKIILLTSSLLIASLGVIWGFIYFLQNAVWAAIIPWCYSFLSFISIFIFSRSGRFGVFRFSQLLLMLLLPFLLALTLGGFVASSGVILWSLTSPLGALLFADRKRAIQWFVAFMALLLLSFALQQYLSPVPLDPWVHTLLFPLNIAGVSVVAFILLYYFMRKKDEAYDLLHLEREKSENLLLNILPEKIAAELKEGRTTNADHFDDASILFADIVNFTPVTARLNPSELVVLLNDVFSSFDHLVEKYDVEKIKTIGDCYMIAAGVPTPRPDHATVLTHLALDVLAQFRSHTFSGQQLTLRIGISSGPVVAGVIGKKKFMYDLWGDAVNVASRMETNGQPGQVQVSEATYSLIQNDFHCKSLGRHKIKGKGEMEVYQVVALK